MVRKAYGDSWAGLQSWAREGSTSTAAATATAARARTTAGLMRVLRRVGRGLRSLRLPGVHLDLLAASTEAASPALLGRLTTLELVSPGERSLPSNIACLLPSLQHLGCSADYLHLKHLQGLGGLAGLLSRVQEPADRGWRWAPGAERAGATDAAGGGPVRPDVPAAAGGLRRTAGKARGFPCVRTGWWCRWGFGAQLLDLNHRRSPFPPTRFWMWATTPR